MCAWWKCGQHKYTWCVAAISMSPAPYGHQQGLFHHSLLGSACSLALDCVMGPRLSCYHIHVVNPGEDQTQDWCPDSNGGNLLMLFSTVYMMCANNSNIRLVYVLMYWVHCTCTCQMLMGLWCIHTQLKVCSCFCISWQVTSWGIPSMWLLASRHLTSNSLSLLMLWVDTAHVSLYLYMYMYVYIFTSFSWVVMQSYRHRSFFVYWCASLWCRHCIRSRSILCPGVFMYVYTCIFTYNYP